MNGRDDSLWLSKLEKVQDQLSAQTAALAAIQATLSAQQNALDLFNAQRMAPLEAAVQANNEFRQKSLGSIKLAMVVLSLVGASILGTGGWMIRTTLLLEERGAQTSQRMDALSDEVAGLEHMIRRMGQD